MKLWYAKNARNRNFKPEDYILVFLPIPGYLLQDRYYYGFYEIKVR